MVGGDGVFKPVVCPPMMTSTEDNKVKICLNRGKTIGPAHPARVVIRHRVNVTSNNFLQMVDVVTSYIIGGGVELWEQ